MNMMNLMPYRNDRMTRQNRNYQNYLEPFFGDFFRPFFGSETGMTMKVDVEDKGDHFLLEADLPGAARENVKVEIDDGVMTISAVILEEKEDVQKNYVCRERRSGSVRRAFRIDGVREDGITAEFRDGVLRLHLPKEVEQPADTVRHIEIA